MTHIAIGTLQAPENCRWSQSPESRRSEGWACGRQHLTHVLTPSDCEACPFWEMEPVTPPPPATKGSGA